MEQEKLSKPKLKLTGEDGNAFSILGRARQAMKKAGYSKQKIDRYQAEATSGDWHHLIATTTEWFDVS